MKKIKKSLGIILVFAMIISCMAVSFTSFAAKGDKFALNTTFSSSKYAIEANKPFTVTLTLNSAEIGTDGAKTMNTHMYTVKYPTDKVEFVSADPSKGLLQYYKGDETAMTIKTDVAGEVGIEFASMGDGIAPSEGSGELFTINFKAKDFTDAFDITIEARDKTNWSDNDGGAYVEGESWFETNPTLKFSLAKPVNGVSIDNTELNMTVGEADKTLTATIDPTDADEQGLTWTSSNPDVASVTGPDKATDGKAAATIKALKAGETTITVTTKDGNKSKECKVTVKENAVIENVEFDASLNINATDKTGTKTLTGNFGTLDLNTLFKYNKDGADIVLEVAIAGGTVLTLNGTVLSYKGIGKEDITVAVKAGPKAANAGDTLETYTITVDVQALEISNDTVKDLTAESTTIKVGETTTIKNPEIDPAVTDDITKATFAYKSENTAVATVDPATGEVKGVAPGTAKIVCEVSYNDKVVATKTIEITVTAADAPATDDPQAPSGQTPGKAPGSTNTGDAGVALAASLSLAAAAAFVLAKKRED